MYFLEAPRVRRLNSKKPDGTTVSANLTKTSFTANSVLYKNVLDAGW
jgi:hypothetical protein